MSIPASETWKAFEQNPLTHSSAHYLMTIAEIQARQGYVRAVDVAGELGITRASCSVAIKNLIKRGLVEEDAHHMLRLSESGLALSRIVETNDQLLETFFSEVLGVPAEQAGIDACKIEHLLSLETSSRLCSFLNILKSEPGLLERIRETIDKTAHDGHATTCEHCDGTCVFSANPDDAPLQPNHSNDAG